MGPSVSMEARQVKQGGRVWGGGAHEDGPVSCDGEPDADGSDARARREAVEPEILQKSVNPERAYLRKCQEQVRIYE